MQYESIDALQKALAVDVFHYTRDSKKAAGRALGTSVEIISFHLLKAWDFGRQTAIERRIPEYANPYLTHNVEFTLHPRQNVLKTKLRNSDLPFTAKKIARAISEYPWNQHKIKANQLLSTKGVLRNACTISEQGNELIIANLGRASKNGWEILIDELSVQPFAMFECKRVGVEEGVTKGPQTIEKAKQGAYVARSISALQRFRKSDGSSYGIMSLSDSSLRIKPYNEFLAAIINSKDEELLRHFILTVGVVSNHGNWFTSDDQNKELSVLAQSYDWLLFLTDAGLAKFIEDLLLTPSITYRNTREAFMNSYSGVRGKNAFTKVTMHLKVDRSIQRYFRENLSEIERWFHVVSPSDTPLDSLKIDLRTLAEKDWQRILQ